MTNKYKLTTTLNEIIKHKPCEYGLDKLKIYLAINNIGSDDQFNLLRILESNGVEHCLWALRACLEKEDIRKVAIEISSKAAVRAREYAVGIDSISGAFSAYHADCAYDAEREKQKQDLLDILKDD